VKYSIITFGCRVNQADSFRIEEELRRHGAIDAAPEDADLVVVNSCSVTGAADQGARQTIRRIVRGNPDVKVVVTGCYASRRPDELRQLPNVFLVVSNERKDSLVGLLEAEGELTTAQRFEGGDGPCGMMLQPGVGGRTALTLRVQTGCDEQCSYCIIPSTRGAGRSHPLSGVLQDIRRAVEAGYREIAITGVHLGSYGRDLGDGTTLTDLVSALASWPDEVLFRISSLEPMDCTQAIVRLASESPRIAPHFHLPLQHGCDEMLAAMRRPYTSTDYRRLVETIRRSIEHASIGTDLIVGFPGETDEHFDDMVRFVASLPVSYLHVFPYSDRPGTAATQLPRKVDGDTIRKRGRVLRAIGTTKAAAFRTAQSGRTVRALTVDDGRSAVTENYLKVQLDDQRPRNAWVSVTL
jgi:threonylcarbamoyladenosine tRNA methylthiotransferase MtaB